MKIKELRTLAGMTQRELADGMGVLPSCVTNWESGLSMPRTAQLPKLAELLHCTIDALFGRDGSAEVTADTAQ